MFTCDKTATPNHLALSPSDGKSVATKFAAVRVNTSATVTTKSCLIRHWTPQLITCHVLQKVLVSDSTAYITAQGHLNLSVNWNALVQHHIALCHELTIDTQWCVLTLWYYCSRKQLCKTTNYAEIRLWRQRHKRKSHQTGTTHQLTVHINISWWTEEWRFLHETNEAPVRIDLVLDLHQDRCQQVWHSLSVAVHWVSHGVVQQDVPGRKQY